MIEITHLLALVDSISRKHREIAKITGHNFNVFNILGVTSNEVRLHSAFIGELLDPEGSHGLGTVFVEGFIQVLKAARSVTFEYDPSRASNTKVEHWLGSKSADKGGFVDIWLEDANGNHVIVENKIYAGDQEKQLRRYHSADTRAPIIYLTLDGSEPSEWSTGGHDGVRERLVLLSYRDDIVTWLESCKRHAVDHSILRESISQYSNLIKQLTHQSPIKNMEKEIVELVTKDPARLKAALEIGNNIHAIKNAMASLLSQQIVSLLSARASTIRLEGRSNLSTARYSNLVFSTDLLRRFDLCIRYQCQNEGLRNIIDGISWIDEEVQRVDSVSKQIVTEAEKQMPGGSLPGGNNKWWPVYWSQGDWSDEMYCKILDGELSEEIFDRVVSMSKLAEAALGGGLGVEKVVGAKEDFNVAPSEMISTAPSV